MRLISVTLEGTLEGVIWEPEFLCEKEFNVTFMPEEHPCPQQWCRYLHHSKLRSALLRITDDGDFQYCNIQYCYLTAKWLDSRGRFISITNELNPSAKDISDLFVQ